MVHYDVADPAKTGQRTESDHASDKNAPQYLSFANNALLPSLYGDADSHLELLEKYLKITAASRGNKVALSGPKSAVDKARRILEHLYARLERGADVTEKEVEAAIRMIKDDSKPDKEQFNLGINDRLEIRTRKKTISPYSNRQADYMRLLFEKEVMFSIGPAGTGKTYIAVAAAVTMLVSGKVERLILSRPAVEAGEKIGFLPGDLKEKIDPYLRPLYDALQDMLPAEKMQEYMENGVIEIAPLAFMRGRTLANAFVILDEAQNTTPSQMKMFLTRLGEHSRMVITGDVTQSDLPSGTLSGLKDAVDRLSNIEEIGFIRFEQTDVVRHPLAARIIKAYDE